jgi:hypothetical protein
MKAVFIALVFGNLAFFAYVQLIGGREEAPAPAASAGTVRRLALFGELAGAPGLRCMSVGPFTEQLNAERAANALRTSTREPRLRTTQAEGGTGFWVSLTTKTLQEAARVAMRLRTAGVTDVEIMPPEAGATEAVVSLGVYSDRERAQRRIGDLKHYAIAPSIVEQPHTITSWWLDVDQQASDPPLDAGTVVKTLVGASAVSVASCPATAAPGSTPPGAPSAPAGAATPGASVPATPEAQPPTTAPAAPASPAPAIPAPAPKPATNALARAGRTGLRERTHG